MTFWQIRLVKRILLIVFVTAGSYVGYQVFRGWSSRDKDVGPRPTEPKEGVSREVQIEQLDSEGRTAWTLKAAEATGRTETTQTFRKVEIRFDAGEEKVPVVVTADRCEIAKDNSIYLEGDVIVRDNTTLRLDASTLHFARSPDRVWSKDPVRYARKGLAGTAESMSYQMEAGVLELDGQVQMTLQQEGDAPVDIESASATMRRGIHLVQFIDSVHVRQSESTLDCNDLQIYLDEADAEMERMEAYENVDLRMNVAKAEPGPRTAGEGPSEEGGSGEPEAAEASSTSPVTLTSEPGTKRLLTDRFEAYFRPGGKFLERARALEGGRLVVRLPDGATSGFHKDLEGYTLAFEFDEQGRLAALRGRGGVTLTLRPVIASEETKTITARQLEADFDPVGGELTEARCEQAVTFEQGNVHASAEKGTYRARDSLLVLDVSPHLWDDTADLEANEITIGVTSGDVRGAGQVRSKSSKSASASGPSFPGGDDAPVYFFADKLRYRKAQDVAAYTGDARAIQGRNRIEAREIDVLRAKGDLTADGNVQTVFYQSLRPRRSGTPGEGPRSGAGSGPTVEPSMTTTDAAHLEYRSAENLLHYRGEVKMRSEEMTLLGDSIDVTLGEGGSAVEDVLASGSVSIDTTDGKATGETAKYLPKDGSMTVSGESASLENAGKLTEGKQLTFFLDDDKVFVDGREITRTKSTYSSKPRL